MMRTRYLLLAGLTAVLVAAGCGGGHKDHGHPPAAASYPPLDVTRIAAATSDFQREILTDGAVSFAEYEKAVLASVSCLRAAGLLVDGPSPRQGDPRFLDYTYGLRSAAEADQAAVNRRIDGAVQRCDAEFRLDVDRVWSFQRLLTPAQREQQRRPVINCLHGAGVDVADDATVDIIFKAAAEHAAEPGVKECGRTFPDFFVVGVR